MSGNGTGNTTAGAGAVVAFRQAWRRAEREAWMRPALMVGFTLLTAAGAMVRVPLPFTPVPLTLQLLPVLLGGALLGRAYGAGAQLLYLGFGMAGLPWFAGTCAAGAGAGSALGLGLFACPTAGYLAAFPLAAWLTGWLGRDRGARGLLAAMLLAVLAVYALGALHLALTLHVPLTYAVLIGVAPFVVADAAKAGAAAALAARLPRSG